MPGAVFKDRFCDLRRGADPRLLRLRATPSSCCNCIGWPPNDRKVRIADQHDLRTPPRNLRLGCGIACNGTSCSLDGSFPRKMCPAEKMVHFPRAQRRASAFLGYRSERHSLAARKCRQAWIAVIASDAGRAECRRSLHTARKADLRTEGTFVLGVSMSAFAKQMDGVYWHSQRPFERGGENDDRLDQVFS